MLRFLILRILPFAFVGFLGMKFDQWLDEHPKIVNAFNAFAELVREETYPAKAEVTSFSWTQGLSDPIQIEVKGEPNSIISFVWDFDWLYGDKRESDGFRIGENGTAHISFVPNDLIFDYSGYKRANDRGIGLNILCNEEVIFEKEFSRIYKKMN